MTSENPQFPDKHFSRTDYSRITAHIQEGAAIAKENSVGQKEATVLVETEYRTQPAYVVFMGDVHYGSTQVDYDFLNQVLDTVEDTPNFFMISMGDDTDNFNAIKHASAAIAEDPITPQIQVQAYMSKLEELDRKGKILGLCYGNHNDWMGVAGLDFYTTFMGNLQAPVLDQGGRLQIIVNGGQRYEIAISHRYWGRSKLNPTNEAKRYMEHEYPNADIIALGDSHKTELLHFDRGDKDRIAMITGTFKLTDAWAAKQGIGHKAGRSGLVVALWPFQRRMVGYREIEVAQWNFMNSIFSEDGLKEQNSQSE